MPASRVRRADGSTALAAHPWDGVGPWFSYDRVQWHKNQLTMARETGIDVILPVFGGGDAAGDGYRLRGLACLSQALKEIRAEGKQPFRRERGYPLVGMWLDLQALPDALGAPPDLKTEAGRQALYSAIRTFYRTIPAEFHALIRPPADTPRARAAEGRTAAESCLVVLTGVSAVKAWDDAAVAYCSRRFAQEFGRGLVWIGGADLVGKAPGLDGYLAAAIPGAPSPAVPGWLKVATVGPVASRSDRMVEKQQDLERLGGHTLIQSFLAALQGGPDWVVVDSWNEFQSGTHVAPTLEYGLQPRDLTDGGVTQFKGTGEFGAVILRATVPEAIAPRTVYQVEALVENTGLKGWGPQNRAGLSYRWYRDGRPVGDPGPLIAAPSLAPGEAKVLTIGITAPMQGARPLADGRYELRLDMMVPPDQWFAGADSSPYTATVTVGAPRAFRLAWLGSDVPALVKSGGTYTASVRARNDGGETWQKARGVALGYRWRRVSDFPATGTSEQEAPLTPTPVAIRLPADVLPGAVVAVPVTVAVLDDKGTPLPPWSPGDRRGYELEWSFFDGEKWLAATEAPTYREAAVVLDADPGPSFIGTGLANELQAGRTVVTNVGLRNIGPDTWKAADTRLGHHWYHFDGSEAIWSAGTTALTRDVKPGEEIVVREVTVTAPDFNGPMYLVFDLQIAGRYASTMTSTRGQDILVLATLINGGRYLPQDLAAVLDTDGISSAGNRTDGDLDGKGGTFPAERLPPYILRQPQGAPALQTSHYPCGLWARPVGTRPSPEGPVRDMVSFRYPDKRERTMNAVSCNGQRLDLSTEPATAVHLLGCATAADATGTITLVFKDGTALQRPLKMSLWTAPPTNGEHTAFGFDYRHTPQGDNVAGGAYLNHYTLRLDNAKALAAVVLPRNPAMKVFALTVETLDARGPANTGGRYRLPPNLQPK